MIAVERYVICEGNRGAFIVSPGYSCHYESSNVLPTLPLGGGSCRASLDLVSISPATSARGCW